MRKKTQRKIEHEQDEPREEGQEVDARVLGQILAAQNVIFALPDATRIAEFYSQTLLSIPGIAACRVCLANQSIQAGQMENTPCAACEVSRRDGNPGSIVPADPNFNCNLINQPDMRVIAINSYQHHFGFFVFKVDQTAGFDAYQPFIKNLSNYVAITFDNRLQKELLESAQHELERRVKERTSDLTTANEELQREITERQRTEKALRESEEQVRQIFDASPVAMILSQGSNERVEWINNKFIELFGYTMEDMPDSEHWWNLAYPEEAYREELKRRWSEDVKQAIREKMDIQPLEATVRCKDGSQRHIEFRLSSIGNKHLVTFVDLTERKQAEIALHEREHHSQSLLRLSRKLEQAQTYADVLNAAQEEVRSVVGYQNLWAYLFTTDKKQANVLFAKGPMSRKVMAPDGTATITIQGDRMMEEFLRTTEIMVVEDAQIDERTDKQLAAKMGNRTLVHVPILLVDQLMGSVGMGTFGDEGIRVPTASEREYLIALAGHIAVTLNRIHLLERRNQVEQELIAREREFRTLAEYSPDNIARYDVNCRTIYVNPTLEKTLGHPAPEMLGTLPMQAGFIDEANEYQEKMVEVLRTGKEQEMDLVLPDTGEGVRYHNIRFVAERGADGAITGILAIGRDFTERKRMEEALSASESELRTLISTMTDVIFVGNSEGRYLKILDTNSSLLYKPPKELLGRTLHEVFPKDQADFFLEKLRQALGTRKSVDFEYSLPIGDTKMWFYATVSPMTDDQTLMVARDITDQKQAEEELRESERRLIAAQHMAHVGYWERDFDTNRVALSDEACRIFGISEQGLSLNLDQWHPRWVALIHPEDQPRLIELLGEVLAGIRSYDVEYRIIRPDGAVRYIYSQAEVRRDVSGHPRNMLGMMQDITERKQAEQALRESERRYHEIFDNVLDGLYLLQVTETGRFRVMEVNPAVERITGILCSSFSGKIPEEILPAEVAEMVNDKLRHCIEVGHPTEEESELDLPVGRRNIYSTLIPAQDEAGRVHRIIGISRDITERKLAENALRESEEKYRLLHENAGVGIGYYKPDGQVISYNQLAASHMQGKPEDFEGKSIYEIFSREEADLYMERIRSSLAADSSISYEDHLELPSGNKWFLSVFTKIQDAQQNAIGVQIISQDISEQKQAGEALRASENRFRVLSENAFVGIYIIQDGRLSYVNSTLAKIFGYTPEELTGAEPALVIHPDDQAMVAENIRRRIVGEIETIHYEFRGRCKDGETKNIEVLGGRIDFSGKTAVIGNLMDITGRKRADDEIARSLAAEKKARQVAEILREANESLSRTLNLDDVLQNLLQYLVELVPYDSANVMLREGDFHFRVVALRGYERWTDIDAAQKLVFDIRTIPSLSELVAAQKSTIIANTYEYPGWQRVPGTEHVVSWMGIPLIADGQVIGLYSVDKVKPAFFTDEHRFLAEGLAAQAAVAIQNTRLHDQITRSNVELEQRVASRTAQLEDANKELEAFAYSVSHDLRAPLRHIDGFIEMLQKRMKTNVDDKSQHYMDVIADSARRMGTLIDDLLSFSRMGRKEMFTSQVDLNDLIQDIVDEFKLETTGRNIQWKISTLPPVTGDRAMLRIVLMNLIANAFKFTRSRTIAQIEIGYEKSETEIVIFIRDNGVGFDMAYADKLFGVFQRLHRQEDFEGTGIGLANVHRVIHRHGGRTWAESKVDQGATFYFSLPISQLER